MIWMILCAFFAAAGLGLALWALFGGCVLPIRAEAVTVYRLAAHEPELERQVQAFVWAHGSGFAAGRLLLVSEDAAAHSAALARHLAAQYACVDWCVCADCQERMQWNRNPK